MNDFSQFIENPVATLILLVTVATSIMAWNDPTLIARFILNPFRVIKHKEYYRTLSSGLIHADGMHLFFNMYSFYIFAFILEQIMGHITFALFYVLSLIMSHISVIAKNQNNPAYNALGASGAVSGMVLAFVMWNPSLNLYLMFIPVPIPGWLFGVLYMAYSQYAAKKGNDNIGHEAHLWGALSGVILAPIMSPAIREGFLEWIGNLI
jgi:membrane associated rhomboid family serine protease